MHFTGLHALPTAPSGVLALKKAVYLAAGFCGGIVWGGAICLSSYSLETYVLGLLWGVPVSDLCIHLLRKY